MVPRVGPWVPGGTRAGHPSGHSVDGPTAPGGRRAPSLVPLVPKHRCSKELPSDSALPRSSAGPASPVRPWRRPLSPRALESRLRAAVPLSCAFRSLTSEGCLCPMITLPLRPGDGAGESCFVAALQGSEQTVWAWLGRRLRLGHRCSLEWGRGWMGTREWDRSQSLWSLCLGPSPSPRPLAPSTCCRWRRPRVRWTACSRSALRTCV